MASRMCAQNEAAEEDDRDDEDDPGDDADPRGHRGEPRAARLGITLDVGRLRWRRGGARDGVVSRHIGVRPATAESLERRGSGSRSTEVGCGGGAVVVATGLVVGSLGDDVCSLISQSMQTVLMRFS